MGFFSGLTSNGLLEVIGRMARNGVRPFASTTAAPQPEERELADRLRPAMDPQRLAMSQALLTGDFGAVSRLTEPLRRKRLAERNARMASHSHSGEPVSERETRAAESGAIPNLLEKGAKMTGPKQRRQAFLDSELIPHGSGLPGGGPWHFDTMNELEAAFDDMAPREELVAIGERGGVVNPRWLRDLDNALARRDADPEMALPFRNFVPESARGADAVVRESEAIRANRRRYREALRAKAPPPVEERYARFFAQYDPYVSEIARRRGVDPSLLLGLSAYESAWGESRMAREQNNPVGATPGGDRSGGLTYPSNQDAWEAWDRRWGARIQGLGSDEERFVDSLLQDNRTVAGGVDQHGAYNSERPSWRGNVLDTIGSVRRRYPDWSKFERQPRYRER